MPLLNRYCVGFWKFILPLMLVAAITMTNPLDLLDRNSIKMFQLMSNAFAQVPAGVTLTVNGSSSPITVPGGAPVSVVVQNGPGTTNDCVTLDLIDFAGFDGIHHQFFTWVTGSTMTLSFAMPTAPGVYVVRYWQGCATQLGASPTVTVALTSTSLPVNVTNAWFDGGNGYGVTQNFGTPPDTSQATRSTLRLFENGKELGPAHSVHAAIRTLGMGRFSHWGASDGSASLYFSASDNTDPRTNGRVYTYSTGGSPPPPPPPPPPLPPPVTGAIGPQPLSATPLSQGTLFAAPNGSGVNCSEGGPCSLATATSRAIAGDIVFLRGGVYPITQNIYFAGTGESSKLIRFESYPNEWAILDGSTLAEGTQVFIRITGDWNVLRRMEIRMMPAQGLYIRGNHNVVDGLSVHHNHISGIHIHNGDYSFPYGALASYNTIQNSTVSDNSDAGPMGDGGNADGISISSGTGNNVLYCLAARNSDDGIDAWRSTNTHIAYSIATGNGIASGNGNGFKGGGAFPSNGTRVDHSIAYQNRSAGFDVNSGVDVRFSALTAWANGSAGFILCWNSPCDLTMVLENSIASGNTANMQGTGSVQNNSWQRLGTVNFISTDPSSANFLQPIAAGGFENLGAWAP
jgi:parallel beta helix pectate lyase-like protein